MAWCAKTVNLTNASFANVQGRTCTINFTSNTIDVTPFDPDGDFPYGLNLSCSPKITITLTSNEDPELLPGDTETVVAVWNTSNVSIAAITTDVTWDADSSKEGQYTTVMSANGAVTIT